MGYEPLEKIYRKNPGKHTQEYQSRFNNPLAEHFDIEIKQYNHKKSYPAFMLVSKEILVLLEKISLRHGDLLRTLNAVPEIVLRQFSLLCLVDEIKSSNDIEGVHSTRRELRNIIDNADANLRFASTVNKYRLLQENEPINFSGSKALREFYDEFVHDEVVAENASNRLDGEIFRKGSVDIDSGTGKTIHRGVFPESVIIDYIDKALSIMNDDSYPVVIRTALSHYLFEYIHPFYDGNGRTARFLASYNLAKVLNPIVAMRLSVTIKRLRTQYYKLFRETDSEYNCGDLTPFVIGFMEIILQTIDDSNSLLERKVIQYKKCITLLDNIPPDQLTKDIYKYLFQSSLLYGQGLRATELASLLGKSRNTIMSRLDKTPEGHIVINQVGTMKYYKLNMMLLKDYI